ncbi:MAG: hypothetical protein KGY74_08745, partial [Candidatus Cloacimonetes bacterium]|nr:hypothetical protein [Candidatus Cloacimonadota bacterium]
MAFKDIVDQEFWQLDKEKQNNIAINYFEKELADSEFYKLPEEKQSKVKQNYLFSVLQPEPAKIDSPAVSTRVKTKEPQKPERYEFVSGEEAPEPYSPEKLKEVKAKTFIAKPPEQSRALTEEENKVISQLRLDGVSQVPYDRFAVMGTYDPNNETALPFKYPKEVKTEEDLKELVEYKKNWIEETKFSAKNVGKTGMASLHNLVGGTYGGIKLGLDLTFDLAYNFCALPQNAVGELFDIDEIKTSSGKFKKQYKVIDKAIDTVLPAREMIDAGRQYSRAKYYDKPFEQYVKEGNWDAALSSVGWQVTENLPQQAEIVGSAILTGNPIYGISLLSMQSGGQKYINLLETDMPKAHMYANALSTALSEFLTENYVGTGRIVRRIMKNRGKKYAVSSLKEGIKNFLISVGMSALS